MTDNTRDIGQPNPIAERTAGPWEVVEATEHHGPYIVNSWGRTICDLYAMSNPLAASIRNGGDSYPISFDDAAANAAFIVHAENLNTALQAEVAELTRQRDDMRKALDERDLFINPHLLEQAADEIDCGDGCECIIREHDTGAAWCKKSEDGDYCPNDVAETLRALAKLSRALASVTSKSGEGK